MYKKSGIEGGGSSSSLPPALLARLAQRGLVQKQKGSEAPAEEVIAEDYDEMETEEQHKGPESYHHHIEKRGKREENFWLERMKARMGVATEEGGYKGCPNKYNIWHKCTLFCVNRWGDGITEPSREYMRRYKQLRRKYPLPKGWTEMYDSGCGCYYFHSATENLVSWLPPTHPKSQVTRTAASLRRQLDESSGETGGGGGSDGEQMDDDDDVHAGKESGEARHQREIDEIINSSLRSRSPQPQPQTPPSLISHEFPSLKDSANAPGPQRKQKTREKTRHRRSARGRQGGGGDADVLDPMDPSAYSDTPRGKWSDGLQTNNEDRNNKISSEAPSEGRKRGAREAVTHSDDDNDVGSDYR